MTSLDSLKEAVAGIIGSASKIAFLGIMATVCIGFLTGKLADQHFMTIAVAAATYYFTHKGKADEPYGGK